MKLAIASGKGGTGKTTVAVNLALVAAEKRDTRLLDCDVEEPNAHLFLHPQIVRSEDVCLAVPVVDEDKCTGCGECARICQFNAIIVLKDKPLLYPELCHACGGCAKICPTRAITETDRPIGTVEEGQARKVEFVHGRLNVGEVSATPLIEAVKDRVATKRLNIVDCPPGTACAMVTAVRKADFGLLVTEPTAFGLHDLALAVETLRALAVPFGVVINRDGIGDDRVDEYCRKESIEILGRIPDNRRLAEAYSRGRTAVETLPEMRGDFQRTLDAALERAGEAR